MTQQQLATAAGVAQSTVASAEKAHRNKPRELVALARALRVYPYWLDTGKGPWDATHAPETVFDSTTDEERELLANFRALLDEDRDEVFQEVEQRAVKARAYARQAFVTLGLQIPPALAAPVQLPRKNLRYPKDELSQTRPALKAAQVPEDSKDGSRSKNLPGSRKRGSGRA